MKLASFALHAHPSHAQWSKFSLPFPPLFYRAEIRVQFRHVPGNLYNQKLGTEFRVQPDEAIYLMINNKVPGLEMKLERSNLNLRYAVRYIYTSHNFL